jgi:hypothetical protein
MEYVETPLDVSSKNFLLSQFVICKIFIYFFSALMQLVKSDRCTFLAIMSVYTKKI